MMSGAASALSQAQRTRLFHRAIAATSTGVVIVDLRLPDQPLVFVNPAFLQLTGYPSDEALGRNCRFMQGPDTDPAAVAEIRDAIAARHDVAVTLRNYRRDGTAFWNALTLSPVPDEEGHVTHYVGVQTDVTAPLQAEEERATLLAREQAARAEAEAAVRVRDRFLSSAAHDLRSPLTAVVGTVQLQQRRLNRGRVPSVDEQRRQLDTLSDLLRCLRSTVDEITDAAQLQMSQSLALRLESIAVGDLVRESVRVVTAARGVPGAMVRVDLPADPVIVVGDRARLDRVLQNIIGNAIKYSLNGMPVRVTVVPGEDGVTITIQDHGVGIPADELPHLFTPFYRASTARGIAGTGLGLSGSKAILEQHGGTIALRSVAGEGTTVTLLLPHTPPSLP